MTRDAFVKELYERRDKVDMYRRYLVERACRSPFVATDYEFDLTRYHAELSALCDFAKKAWGEANAGL